MKPRLLKELTTVISFLQLITFTKSWNTMDIPEDQKSSNVPIFKRVKRMALGNYRLVIIG